MKILAVDDDPVFLSVLEPMLRSFGQNDVTVVNSADDALDMISQSKTAFDCFLLDIQMPGTNGIALCQKIRRISGYQRTPIVMVTSLSDRVSIDDAFAHGATDYVTKPLDGLELRARLGMVERLLSERHLAAVLQQQIASQSTEIVVHVDFEQPLLIPGFDRGIEYLALENYLLTIGRKRVHATSAIGISVQNASSFFRKSSPSNFVNMLGDVAAAISDAFKTEQMLIAYAGAGNFVCVSDGTTNLDLDELEIMIQMGVDAFENIYAMDNLPPPCIRIGQSVRSSFFGLINPTSILNRAISLSASGTSPLKLAYTGSVV